ncbi:hypothetical protein QTN25_008324 [Entamoeba marina]
MTQLSPYHICCINNYLNKETFNKLPLVNSKFNKLEKHYKLVYPPFEHHLFKLKSNPFDHYLVKIKSDPIKLKYPFRYICSHEYYQKYSMRQFQIDNLFDLHECSIDYLNFIWYDSDEVFKYKYWFKPIISKYNTDIIGYALMSDQLEMMLFLSYYDYTYGYSKIKLVSREHNITITIVHDKRPIVALYVNGRSFDVQRLEKIDEDENYITYSLKLGILKVFLREYVTVFVGVREPTPKIIYFNSQT